MKRNHIVYIVWLILVIIWNYAYPNVKPIYDVLMAVLLSLLSIFLNKNH